MSIEIIQPNDEKQWLELRTKDITSTEVSALFGISPYMTKFELWHRKHRGEVVKFDPNERMKWGTRLQDAIAAGIAEENKWSVMRMTEYIRDPELRAGASFDFSLDTYESENSEPGLLEIKNVDSLQFKNEWTQDDEGNIEAPPHIEIQVQHQLMVSMRRFAYIGALVGGNKLVLIKRTRDENVIRRIREVIAEFWGTIEANIPPSPDFEKDADFIKDLYKYAEPGTIMDARGNSDILDMCLEYKRLQAVRDEAENKRDAIKAKLLTIIGNAEKVQGEGFSISAGIVGESPRNFIMPAYRMFRVNWSKKK